MSVNYLVQISQLKFGNTCPVLDSPDHGELQIQGRLDMMT